MKVIEKLSEEQEEDLPKFMEKWRQIGLCTDPIDIGKAEKSIKNLYKVAGLDEPLVLFFDSPVQCLVARKIMWQACKDAKEAGLTGRLDGQLAEQLDGRLGGQVGSQFRRQLAAQLDGQLAGQLRSKLRRQISMHLGALFRGQLAEQLMHLGVLFGDQLFNQLDGQLAEQLDGRLMDQLGGQLRSNLNYQLAVRLAVQLRSQLGTRPEDQLRSEFLDEVASLIELQFDGQLIDRLDLKDLYQSLLTAGGLDSYWLALYKFTEKIGVKYNNQEHLDAYVDYAENCGVMFAYESVAFCSDRPSKLKLDENNLLHCDDGAAFEFRDGYKIYSWHGTRIHGEWIEKGIDEKTALTQDNMELRRAACEIVGWANILKKLNAVCIDASPNPFVGELLEVELSEGEKEKFLRVMCGTDREFALPVPPEMQRASQAQAWLNFTTEDMYVPKIRT